MKGNVRFVAVVALLVLAAACGGDDSADAGDDAGGGSDAQTATTFPSTVGDIPGVSGECEALANLSLAISGVLTGTFDGLPDDVVGNLPGDAQADGEIVADAVQEFSDRLDELGIDLSQGLGNLSAEQLQAFSDISGEVFNDDVDAAVNRIGITMADDCAPGG